MRGAMMPAQSAYFTQDNGLARCETFLWRNARRRQHGAMAQFLFADIDFGARKMMSAHEAMPFSTA